MKTKCLPIYATAGSSLAFLAILLYLPFTACDNNPPPPPPCVATECNIGALPMNVCGAGYGYGDDTVLSMRVYFKRGGSACLPAKPKLTVSRNGTPLSGVKWTSDAGMGIYQGILGGVKVPAETQFSLVASGDSSHTVSSSVTVKVISPSEPIECCASRGDYAGLGVWNFSLNGDNYAANAVIAQVENVATSVYPVEVIYHQRSAKLNPGAKTNQFEGLDLKDTLKLLLDKGDANDWENSHREFCIRIYLTCKKG